MPSPTERDLTEHRSTSATREAHRRDSAELATLGLRERKKARTRAAIQRHALRLFREQGYESTTVSQIAEAAEVSESTFFRYFPTKEAVALWDQFDPLFMEALRAQPPDLGPIPAFRAAVREVFGQLDGAEREDLRQRTRLILAVPELRAASFEQLVPATRLFAGLLAERVGRSADDGAVRALAGAVIGATMAAMLPMIEDPGADLFALMDEAMAYLEAGLRL